MVGRLCLSAAWQVLYVWCVELFPTTIRVTMLQVTLISGHIGSMIGPLTADLVSQWYDHGLATPNSETTVIVLTKK